MSMQAIENVKAAAAGITQSNKVNAEKPADLPKARPSSTLPSNFFDNRETKRQKDGKLPLLCSFCHPQLIIIMYE